MKERDKYALKETTKEVIKWILVVVIGFAYGSLIASCELSFGATVALIVGPPLLLYIAGDFLYHRDNYRP